jgi:hypothetical protein
LLREKNVRGHEIGISVFSPFTPMLGERGAPDQVMFYFFIVLSYSVP